MSDRTKKIWIALLIILISISLLIGIWTGLINWDIQKGIFVYIAITLALFIVALVLYFRIKSHSWVSVFLPYFYGVLYTIIPDAFPFSIDDGIVLTSGVVLSSLLAIRKDERIPKWFIAPLIFAGIYAFFGGVIFGPIDEIIVTSVAFLTTIYGIRKNVRTA